MSTKSGNTRRRHVDPNVLVSSISIVRDDYCARLSPSQFVGLIDGKGSNYARNSLIYRNKYAPVDVRPLATAANNSAVRTIDIDIVETRAHDPLEVT
jgi:hypothetical protein